MKRIELRASDFLQYMLRSTQRIQPSSEGKTYVDFTTEQILHDAVLHNIEVFGSAAKDVLHALPPAAPRFPQILSRQSVGCVTGFRTATPLLMKT